MNGQPDSTPPPGPACPAELVARPPDGLPITRLRLLDREWFLERPASLEALWEAATPQSFGADERMPYWAELWPSSLALANWLGRVKNDIAGQVCLDLGCGLGLTAIVGAALGARVLAFDYEPAAAGAAARNAALNRAGGVFSLAMDWRAPALKPRAARRAWAGDIMYERRFARPVADFLAHAIAPGGVMWLAEPSRTVYREFLALLRAAGWQTRKAHQEAAGFIDERGRDLPGPRSTVQIWELSRPKE